MLLNRRLKRPVDVTQPVAQDVAEPNQNRQPDPAQLQVVDQLFQVDGFTRLLGRVRQHVSVVAD
jgi:hypothetical protein